ncbi:uncharacterized protein LOC127158239 [Labeo rohita]|uniref:uncharacterized protein LOC127158239 n=1 Tax=Labeo rohita TaxID=84645 RepID=UPI0021E2FB03|nr:uncharacterized protein LOC127158239 [Labeo rohita]
MLIDISFKEALEFCRQRCSSYFQIEDEPKTRAWFQDVSRDDTETSGSERDSEPELTEDVIEPLPVASSTRFAVPKGPSDISRSREEGPVQPCLTTFPRTQHGTRKRAFNSSWYKDNSWLEYSKLYNFVSGSYVHLKWLAVQKDLYPQQQPRELQRLTDLYESDLEDLKHEVHQTKRLLERREKSGGFELVVQVGRVLPSLLRAA